MEENKLISKHIKETPDDDWQYQWRLLLKGVRSVPEPQKSRQL